VQEVLAQHKLRPKYIVATHAHIDHVGSRQLLIRSVSRDVKIYST
jgi:glyoxylase-like metal-dependent hydrolase (beta-lactamase superfamily II)